jgi:hypothetical protein
MADYSLSPALRESLDRLEAELARNAELRHAYAVAERSALARLVAFVDSLKRSRGTAGFVAVVVAFAVATCAAQSAQAPAPRPTAQNVSAACLIHGPLLSGPFAGIDAFVQDGTRLNIVDGRDIPQTAGYAIYGWGRDHSGYVAARGVCLIVDGKVEDRATSFYGEPRADVAKVLKIPALLFSGYLIKIPPGTLLPGAHRIGVAVVSADGSLAGNSVIRSVTVH